MKSVEPIRDIKTIKNMRSILKEQSPRNELLFILGINVGLLISDIRMLKVEDLVDNGNIPKDYITITEKKTGKIKEFYIGDIVKEVIETYINENKDIKNDDYIFKSRKGENNPITRQQAYRILNGAAEALGMVERNENGVIISGEIGTHTLRKTFGYHAYKAGTTLDLLMNIFNHSSKSQTLKYIGITEDQKKAIYFQSNLG